jgi:hypothetical protein
MMVRQSPSRPVLAALIVTALLAGCSEKTAPEAPQPAAIGTAASLPVNGVAGESLADSVRVRVTDSRGRPVSGVSVAFAVQGGGGAAAPGTSLTDGDGVARTRWTLGTSAGANVLAATVAGLSPLYLAVTGEPGPVTQIVVDPPTAELYVGATLQLDANARDQHANRVTAAAIAWSSSDDARATVSASGLLTAHAAGEVMVTAAHGTVSGAAVIEVSSDACEAALDLEVGEHVIVPFPSACSVLLSERPGAVYRVGVMARKYDTNGAVSASVAGGILVDRRALSSSGGSLPGAVAGAPDLRLRHEDLSFDAGTRRLMQATEALHMRLREEEIRRFGRGLPPPLGPHDAQLALAAASATLDTARTFWINNPAGGARLQINARLRAVGEHIIYYEQAGMTGSDAATEAEVQAAIAYYDTHGKPLIDSVFGGLGPPGTTSTFAGTARLAADLDGNGKAVLLQISAANMIDEAAAYVTSCDRYPRLENYASGPYYCSGSNEAEIMYMLRPNSDFFLGTVVHEAKHISSLGYAVLAGRGFQPSWIEEGTAEIAKELSSRRASGHDYAERLALAHVYPGGQLTAEGYGMAVVHARSRAFLAASPLNSVIGNPNPNTRNSTYYGASWLFHRFLADQYANGDVTGFFRALNVTGTGPARLEAVTGRTFPTLLAEFMVALVLEGEPAAWAASPVRFTSYDYAEITAPFVTWTWPYFVHTGSFATGATQLSTVYGSTSFFQLSSPGGLVQRLELARLDSEPLVASNDVVLTIVRVR